MNTSSKNYPAFRNVMHSMLRFLGPQEVLKEPSEALNFEDNIKCDSWYFSGGFLLRGLVVDKLGKKWSKLNDATAYQMFSRLCHHLYNRIKEREGEIQETLNKYLKEEDVEAAALLFTKLLEDSDGKYKVVLVTNLVNLKDVSSVRVGDVFIRRLDADYVQDWPDSGAEYGDLSKLTVLSNRPQYQSKQKFLESNQDNCVLEAYIEGNHFDKEQSFVFDSAVSAFKRFFSYLYVCKFFFENVEKGEFKIETPQDTLGNIFGETMPVGTQSYYILKPSDPSFFKVIYMRRQNRVLSKDSFVVTKSLIDRLNKDCSLSQFNDAFQDGHVSEIRDKIARCLDWYFKAEVETDFTDEVLSLFISLETLLAPQADFLTSHTDDMAENVAIMMYTDTDERYEAKKQFKKRYALRNKIAHHGASLDRYEHLATARALRTDIVWSVRGILARIDDIRKYGNDSAAMKEYFEREKLK